MKRWLLAIALLASGAPPLPAQQGVPRRIEDFPLKLTSDHYDLHTNGTKEQGDELLEFMELVYTTYTALLKPDDPKALVGKRSAILLYKNNEDYLASGAPRGSGAYYSLQSKQLVGWYDKYLMQPFFAHEGMHQFTDLTTKSFKDFDMWFTEGIADCIGNSLVKKKKLYMCQKAGAIARMRLPIVQKAIKDKKHWSLSDLFKLDQRRFMDPKNVSLAYAQSWSFCHFLMTYPDMEDRSHQIPDGKYRRNLATYYELMRPGGVSHDKAWAEAFKGIPLSRLQEQWEEYVSKFDPPKLMGFMGGELKPEEADQLGLEKDKTGIRMEKIGEEGVARDVGMKDGDILLKFDGKLFPRDDAMGMLRQWLGELPYGRSVKVTVLRDGKEVDFTCKWDKPK